MTKQASSRLPEFSQRWKPREPGTCDLDQIRHWCDEGVPIGFHPAAAGQCVIQIEPGIPIPVSLPETRAVRTRKEPSSSTTQWSWNCLQPSLSYPSGSPFSIPCCWTPPLGTRLSIRETLCPHRHGWFDGL